MRYLFFFVHPSKFHLFRNTINQLKSEGHVVDILITSKDMLEDLVKSEGWEYTNIFPEGRRIKGYSTYLSVIINLFRTIYRLMKYINGKKYDLYVTDDLLTIVGRLKGVKSVFFGDDDIKAVPESFLLYLSANYILTPEYTKIGRYEKKKIGFKGFKASAYLHPNSFKPNYQPVNLLLKGKRKYFLIRLVSLKATHDIGKKGIDDSILRKLIDILLPFGDVYISSQRELLPEFTKYEISIRPEDMAHFINYAELFISDSQTMSSEAGLLGTPFIRFNDFIGKISYLDELENKYHLGYGIPTNQTEKLFATVASLIENTNIRHEWLTKKELLFSQTIDLSKFMYWLFVGSPQSFQEFFINPDIQLRFK